MEGILGHRLAPVKAVSIGGPGAGAPGGKAGHESVCARDSESWSPLLCDPRGGLATMKK